MGKRSYQKMLMFIVTVLLLITTASAKESPINATQHIGTVATYGEDTFTIWNGDLYYGYEKAETGEITWVICREDTLFWSKLEGDETNIHYRQLPSGHEGILYHAPSQVESFDVVADELYYLHDGSLIRVNLDSDESSIVSSGNFEQGFYFTPQGNIEYIEKSYVDLFPETQEDYSGYQELWIPKFWDGKATLFGDGAVSADFVSNSSKRQYIESAISYYLTTYPTLTQTLRDNKPVVFFFEGGSDNCDGAGYNWSLNRTGAVYIIIRYRSGTETPYIADYSENCSTIPDYPLGYGQYSGNGGMGSSYGTATLIDGIYELYSVNHKGDYASYQIRRNGSAYVPAIYMKNDGSYSHHNASGIHTHTRTMGNVSSSSSSPWSAGCFLIGSSTPFNQYNAYVTNINGGSNNLSSTTYNRNAIYKFSSTGNYKGDIVVNRYLAQTELVSLYQNANAVEEITSFSPTTFAVPSDATVSTDKHLYIVGDTVTIIPSATNTHHFTMRIDDESGETIFRDYEGFTGSKAYVAEKAGMFTVHISAYNPSGTVWENAQCQFTVLEKPTDVSVTTDRSVYVVGDPVAITPAAIGSDSFTMRIDDESSETLFRDYEGFTGTKTYVAEKAGTFTVHISAYSHSGAIWENAQCQFTVLEKPTDVSVTTDRSVYVVGDPVAITPAATGSNNFTMRIDDESGETIFRDYEGFTGVKTYVAEKAGAFTVHISAYSHSGAIWENAQCQFTVLEKPTDVSVTTDRSVYVVGDPVAITPAATGSNNFTMRIDNESGETIFRDYEGFTGTKTYVAEKAGAFTVHISAYSHSGRWEDAQCQFTVLEKPTDVFVTTDRSVYVVGDPVAITPAAIGSNNFTMRIDDESGETIFRDYEGFTGTKTYVAEKVGTFTVHISAYSHAGVWEDAQCQFTVLEKPIDVSVTTDCSVYVVGDPVIITPAATGSNNFTMRIDDESGETIFRDYDGFTGTKTYNAEKAGTFTIHISAYNNAGTIWEDAICTFVVLENATSSIQSVVLDEGAVVVQLFCQDTSANVFCAVYNADGKMISVESQAITTAQRYTFQFRDIQFTYAKAFIVDSDFRPLCESKRS